MTFDSQPSSYNPIVGGGGGEASEHPYPSGFSCAIAKLLEIDSWNFLAVNGHSLRTFCEFFGPRSVSWPSFKKTSQLRRGYIWCRIGMKLTRLLEVISTYKMYASSFFYPGDLRSGQFRYTCITKLYNKYKYVSIPIISLWEIWKCFPFCIKRSRPPNSFRIMATYPYLCRSGCNWRSLVAGRSPEIKWGRSPFFANKSRQDEWR